MTVNFKEVSYKNYGKCLSISNELMEVYVTIDVGPRVIKCNIIGGENLMFNDVDRNASEDVSSSFGEGAKWYIYGGHRLWISPENMPLTYYPDNEPVKYEIEGNSVLFTPPAQKVNDVQHTLKLTMDADKPVVDVCHGIVNLSDAPMTGAAWALSVMAPEGMVICPQPDEDTGLLGNRILALWPYTKFSDPRMQLFEKYILVTQDPEIDQKFKFGINNTKKWLAYYNHGQLFKKTYNPNHPDGNYPDFGVSTEVFTNHLFIEAETLSELVTLGKGEKLTHCESWSVVKADEPDFCCSGCVDGYIAAHAVK